MLRMGIQGPEARASPELVLRPTSGISLCITLALSKNFNRQSCVRRQHHTDEKSQLPMFSWHAQERMHGRGRRGEGGKLVLNGVTHVKKFKFQKWVGVELLSPVRLRRQIPASPADAWLPTSLLRWVSPQCSEKPRATPQ